MKRNLLNTYKNVLQNTFKNLSSSQTIDNVERSGRVFNIWAAIKKHEREEKRHRFNMFKGLVTMGLVYTGYYGLNNYEIEVYNLHGNHRIMLRRKL